MAEPHSTSKGICIAQNLPIRPPKRREKRPLHPLDPLIRISSVEDHFAIGICLEEFLDEEVTRGAEHALTYHAFVPRLLFLLSTFDIVRDAKGVRLPQAISNDSKLPKIDIFITYCGEGLDILTDTVKAACHQNYPSSLFRVIILDDSSSQDVSSAITELQPVVPPPLHYATRNVKPNTHSKAANLNFGLRFIDTLPNERATYLAVLDVDMIPSAHWLRTVLAHLLHNASAGLACPFQRLYNIAPNDPLGITPEFDFFEITSVLQDFGDSSVCTGSGFLIRRRALDAINGFPEESLQEDVVTTMALSAKGFRTVYVDGELQWGLAANTVPDWIRQRQRWTAGFLSISSYVLSKQGRDLPLRARVSGALFGVIEGTTSGIWTIALFLVPLLVAGRDVLEKFLLGMGWPPLFSHCLLSAKSAWTPISYAFAPPALVEREQLLDRTDQAMVAQPKKNVKKRHMERKSQFFWLALAVYHVLCGMISEKIS
ncbi:MAG: hypothetical protein LQ344_001822 [Seirophora lacunosa]|nr:MAG: hypothetical protein LQ344_001822 [Seirophora lacunosa]